MAEPCTSSGLKTADGIITAIPGRLFNVQVLTDGTNDATVILYDNASAASGTVLCKFLVPGTALAGSPNMPNSGIVANKGIYLDINGTGAACVIQFTTGV